VLESVSALAALAALLLCGAWLGSGLPGRWRVFPVACTVAVLLALGWLGWSVDAQLPGESAPQAHEGYAQSQTCGSCHSDHFTAWKKTWHRTMTQDPTDETVLGDFNNVTFDSLGTRFRMFRRGADFMMELDDTEGRMRSQVSRLVSWPEGPPGILTFRVDRLLGSHNMQAYLTRLSDGRIILLPLFWHPSEKRWLARTAAFLVPPGEGAMDYTALWNAACVFCHNTRAHAGYIVEGNRDLGFDTRFEEMGVACESCHGPGERHAQANQNPVRRYLMNLTGQTDKSIVSPLKLDPVKSVEACGRCHGKWHSNEHATMLRHVDDFIPGGPPLAERYHNVFATQLPTPELGHGEQMEPKAGFFWPDWTPQSTAMEHQGMILSKCAEKGGMTCLHCHSMHRSDPDNQLKVQDDNRKPFEEHNASCTQCHKALASAEAIEKHAHHKPEGTGGRCVACHMPYQGYGLLKSARAHRITVPQVALTVSAGLPNACTTCHVDQTLKWASAKMTEFWNTPPVAVDAENSVVPASVVDMLRGHALQRALAVLSLRRAAEEGNPWVQRTAPLLLDLMKDEPYHTVRLLSFYALRAQPAFRDATFEYMEEPQERARLVESLRERLPPTAVEAADRAPLVELPMLQKLRAQRDDQEIFVQE